MKSCFAAENSAITKSTKLRTTIGQNFRTLRKFFRSDKAGRFEGVRALKSWRALRLCVSYLSHAKAQSSQNGKACKWYLVAAVPRWVLRALRGSSFCPHVAAFWPHSNFGTVRETMVL